MHLSSEPRKWSELKIKLLNVWIDVYFLLNSFIMHLLIFTYKSYLWIKEENRIVQNNIYSKNDKEQYLVCYSRKVFNSVSCLIYFALVYVLSKKEMQATFWRMDLFL